jgi:hypothetical protein
MPPEYARNRSIMTSRAMIGLILHAIDVRGAEHQR